MKNALEWVIYFGVCIFLEMAKVLIFLINSLIPISSLMYFDKVTYSDSMVMRKALYFKLKNQVRVHFINIIIKPVRDFM